MNCINCVLLTGYVAQRPSRVALRPPIPAPTTLVLWVPRRGADATDWIGVTFIGAAADVAADLPVGAPVAIDGYLHSTTPAGGGHRLEVVASRLWDLTPDPPGHPTRTRQAQQ